MLGFFTSHTKRAISPFFQSLTIERFLVKKIADKSALVKMGIQTGTELNVMDAKPSIIGDDLPQIDKISFNNDDVLKEIRFYLRKLG